MGGDGDRVDPIGNVCDAYASRLIPNVEGDTDDTGDGRAEETHVWLRGKPARHRQIAEQ